MDFVVDALKDSLILVPFLLGAYILIELLETYTSKRLKQSTLKSPYAPLVGAGFGLLPQCGFSVVATDLYSQKKLTMGTLIAIYIATSDEAVPMMLTNPSKIAYLLPLLLIKFIYAIIIGYAIELTCRGVAKRKPQTQILHCPVEVDSANEHQEHSENEEVSHIGCCGHHIEEQKNEKPWHRYLLHPALHTLKIFGFVLAINLLFGGLIELIGEDAFSDFLGGSFAFAPLFSTLIGLIPNCASSIIITELFIKGGLSFGACLGGLCCNAGLGLVVLFRQNKNIKNNLWIIGILFLASLAIGYIMQYLVMLF